VGDRASAWSGTRSSPERRRKSGLQAAPAVVLLGPMEVAVADVAYRSEVRIERLKGPLRRAWLPVESQPVWFGTHGAVAAHYGTKPGEYEAHATTLDYVVAATAG
jgi:hypothetical protein